MEPNTCTIDGASEPSIRKDRVKQAEQNSNSMNSSTVFFQRPCSIALTSLTLHVQ
jgi:hypothetical protein